MFSRLASRTRLAAVAAVVAFCASAGSARAETITFSGKTTNGSSNDGVSFGATMTLSTPVTVGGTTTATLTVTLTNTTGATYPGSDAVAHGYITGFGFNLPTGVTASNPTSTDADFNLLSSSSKTTLQGGAFDYAFTTGTQLHTVADSDIKEGLKSGQSSTFTVKLTGSGLIGLTAANLIKELSAPTSGSQGKVPFSVRFRSDDPGVYKGEYQGTAPPDGDKVPYSPSTVTTPPTNPPGAVPAPPGVVLAGFGFGTMLLARLRRKK